MTPRAACPGCGRDVRILPPRTTGSRWPAPWRRQRHYLPGSDRRCRHPVDLTPEELEHLQCST